MPPQAFDPSVQTVVNSTNPNSNMDPYYHHHQQQQQQQQQAAAAMNMYSSSYPMSAYAAPSYNGHTGYPQQQQQQQPVQQQGNNCGVPPAANGGWGYNPYGQQQAGVPGVPGMQVGAVGGMGMVPASFGAPQMAGTGAMAGATVDPNNSFSNVTDAGAATGGPGYEVILPHENDVLMGRGGKNNQHIGNERLRDMARNVRDRYKKSSKKGKSNMSRELVQKVRTELDPPGRFLKRNPVTSEWEDVGDEIAREKVSQVLRDAVSEWTGPKAQAKQQQEEKEQQQKELEQAVAVEDEEDQDSTTSSKRKKTKTTSTTTAAVKRALSSGTMDSTPPPSKGGSSSSSLKPSTTPPTSPPRAAAKNSNRRSRSNSPTTNPPKTAAAAAAIPTKPSAASTNSAAVKASASLPVPASINARQVTETTSNVSEPAAKNPPPATTNTSAAPIAPTTNGTISHPRTKQAATVSTTTTTTKSPSPTPPPLILPGAGSGFLRMRANTAESDISYDDVSFAPSEGDLDDAASLGGMGLGLGLGGLEEGDEDLGDEQEQEKTPNKNAAAAVPASAAGQPQQRGTKTFRRMPPSSISAPAIPGVYGSFRNKGKQRKTNMLERYSNMGMGVSDMSISSELSSRSLMNGTQLSSRQLQATGARQMSNRQLSSRQLSSRQLSSRQLSSRQLSSRQLSSRQLSSRTLSSRQLSARQLSRRGLMSSAMMGESELSLDSLSICDDYTITSTATGTKQLSRKNVFMEQYMSMDMGLSDFSLGSLPEGGVDLDLGAMGASFAGGASSARYPRPSVIIEGDLLEEVSEHSGMDATIKPSELLDMYAATGVGNSISNMTMNTLGTFSGHSRSMGMSVTGTSSRGLYASGKAGTGNSLRMESGHSFIGDAANDLELDMLDDDLFDDYEYMDDHDEFSTEFC